MILPVNNLDKSQKGNVLFLILIAVALFAALSYAVTQSTRGGGNADDETIKTEASQIVQYASSVKTAVQRMRLIGGYDWTEVDSQGPGTNNPNCPDDGCRVFNPDQYGVLYVAPKEKWLIPDNGDSRWGEYRISHFPVDGVGSDAANSQELVLVLHFIKEEYCSEINESLGIVSSGDANPVASLSINTIPWYTGATTGGNRLTDPGDLLFGQETGCYSGGTNFTFYQVIDIK